MLTVGVWVLYWAKTIAIVPFTKTKIRNVENVKTKNMVYMSILKERQLKTAIFTYIWKEKNVTLYVGFVSHLSKLYPWVCYKIWQYIASVLHIDRESCCLAYDRPLQILWWSNIFVVGASLKGIVWKVAAPLHINWHNFFHRRRWEWIWCCHD